MPIIKPCPVEIAVDLVGDKWKILIIRNLLLLGTQRFLELHKGIEGISQKMLTQQLRALESDGLISRKVYAEVPPKVEYALTEFGTSFKPIFDALKTWGSTYIEEKSLK